MMDQTKSTFDPEPDDAQLDAMSEQAYRWVLSMQLTVIFFFAVIAMQ